MPRVVTRMEEADGPGGDFSCTIQTVVTGFSASWAT